MRHEHLGFQLDWDTDQLRRGWAKGPDEHFLFRRLQELTVETTLAGGAQRVLDVAAAEAVNTIEMQARGVNAVALDPSLAMLARAREGMVQRGFTPALVRGVGEMLPFPDATFDRVLCHSAIDHVADPDLAVREMTRVLRPDGRLVISAVNYGGVSARVSRALYRGARLLRLLEDENVNHQEWDSPVPVEHTFECSLPVLRKLCEPYLELERSFGVSIGWGMPGWPRLLARLPERGAALLRLLDRSAQRLPQLSDFIYAVFRPRPRSSWPVRRPAEAGGYVIQPRAVTYPFQAKREIAYWDLSSYTGGFVQAGPVGGAWANTAYTGDPTRSWRDDLIGRGPFDTAAVLGCDGEHHEAAWLRAGASRRLDVYDLSPHALRLLRAELRPWGQQASFIRADLNFVELPVEHYDVIWSSGCLHHIMNLEHLLDQVRRALRPGGLFVVHDYVGEPHMQFSPARLARVNALLDEIPLRFRRGGAAPIGVPEKDETSPFCGMRPAELLPLASARFTPLHVAQFGYLVPLPLKLDLDALAAEAPELLQRLKTAEVEASHDPNLLPATAYAVFRRA
jgi:ubiquinone/menaquinone biosynthesis C-methylase UbiE